MTNKTHSDVKKHHESTNQHVTNGQNVSFSSLFRLVAQYYMSLSQLFLLEVHYFSTTSQSSSNHVLHSGTAKLALLGIP